MATNQVNVTVVGLDKAIADVKKFAFIKREAIRIAVKETTLDVERTAKEFVAVDTGRLKASITHDLSGLLGGLTFSGIVTTPVKYAAFLEFGTRKMTPRPYLYPAWRIGQADLILRVSAILKKQV